MRYQIGNTSGNHKFYAATSATTSTELFRIQGNGQIVIPVFVKFDGSDSNTDTVLLNEDPKDVHIGMRVKVVWAKELKGGLGDIEGVEPL